VGFGAGVLLDSKDNFFIIGGVDSTLSERGELYVFQLQDPFLQALQRYGSCTNIGQGRRDIRLLHSMHG
jgi:hypothetical protein